MIASDYELLLPLMVNNFVIYMHVSSAISLHYIYITLCYSGELVEVDYFILYF